MQAVAGTRCVGGAEDMDNDICGRLEAKSGSHCTDYPPAADYGGPAACTRYTQACTGRCHIQQPDKLLAPGITKRPYSVTTSQSGFRRVLQLILVPNTHTRQTTSPAKTTRLHTHRQARLGRTHLAASTPRQPSVITSLQVRFIAVGSATHARKSLFKYEDTH